MPLAGVAYPQTKRGGESSGNSGNKYRWCRQRPGNVSKGFEPLKLVALLWVSLRRALGSHWPEAGAGQGESPARSELGSHKRLA